jgi:hypothetical protein
MLTSARLRRPAARGPGCAGSSIHELGLILRVYPTEEGMVDQIVDALVGAEKHTSVEHAFVDLMEVCQDIDNALGMISQILERARNA